MLVFAATANADIIFPDGNITKEALGNAPATVDWTAPATATEGTLTPPTTCTPSSGAAFAVGTTPVNCTGMVMGTLCVPIDPMHPELGCIPIPAFPMPVVGGFNVTITPGAGPVLAGLTDRTAETTGESAVVSYDLPTATDPSGVEPGSVACSPGSGSAFPVGSTVVTCGAKDTVGNASSATFRVTVAQKSAPPVIVKPKPLALESSKGSVKGKFAYVTVSCPATNPSACAGTLVLNAVKKHRTGKKASAARATRLGKAKFRIAKGKSKAVKVKLTRKAQKLIARKRKLRTKATATTGKLKSSRTITLRVVNKHHPKKKRRH
jgi:hypothetical protein